jgi:hypothetical protein
MLLHVTVALADLLRRTILGLALEILRFLTAFLLFATTHV